MIFHIYLLSVEMSDTEDHSPGIFATTAVAQGGGVGAKTWGLCPMPWIDWGSQMLMGVQVYHSYGSGL